MKVLTHLMKHWSLISISPFESHSGSSSDISEDYDSQDNQRVLSATGI